MFIMVRRNFVVCHPLMKFLFQYDKTSTSCRFLATAKKVTKKQQPNITEISSLPLLVDSESSSDKTIHIPTDTLYVIDGTAMLFQAYFSQEHSYGYKKDVFSKELNDKLLSTLPIELIDQIQAQNDRLSSNFVIDTTIGIEEVIAPNNDTNEVEMKLNVSSSILPMVNVSGLTPLQLKCGAVTLMAMQLARFVRDVKPKYLAVAFDAAKKTFRNDLFPKYKQQRLSVSSICPYS